MTGDIPASGTLKQYKLHQILTYLSEKQKNGILIVKDKNLKKNIYIENGCIIHASSNQNEDLIGVLLLKSGKITPQQRDKSLEVAKKTGKRIGMILIEGGYITPQDLFAALKQQIKNITFSLLLWHDGVFSFKEYCTFSDFIKIKVNIEKIVHEGLIHREKQMRDEHRVFMERTEELYKKLSMHSLSYYDVLGLPIDAPSSEVKKAYLKMVRIYHPDKHYNLTSFDIKEKIESLFNFINKAYETLIDEEKRRDYKGIILKKGRIEPTADIQDRGEEQFKKGVKELRKGNYWGAADIFRGATRKNQQNADYWAYLSYALLNIPKREKEAEETILRAIQLEPRNPNHYVHLGNIYHKAGMNKRALRQFEIALDCDPVNEVAQKKIKELKQKN
jgi:tetratricopeptide (TPR) repeat protein